MTFSEKKIRANRQNARKSTGPRTKAGKCRASRNALRHGLTMAVNDDPEREERAGIFVSQLLDAYAPEANELRDAARHVSEADAAVARVRCVRRGLLNLMEAGHPTAVNRTASDVLDVLDQICRLERYEQRSRRRRGRAIQRWLLKLESYHAPGKGGFIV